MTLGCPEPQTRGVCRSTGLNREEAALIVGALSLGAATRMLPGRLRLPANLAIALLASRFASAYGARSAAQGMRPGNALTGFVWGLLASSLIAIFVVAGLALNRARGLYQAKHITTASVPRAAFEVFLRIPVGTAFSEEVVFRGALLGLLMRRHSRRDAAVLCSVAFGLWHIVPTLHDTTASPVARGRTPPVKALWVLASVGSTSIAGVGLAWLRLRSGSIVAPWLAHFSANAVGYSASWFASRSPTMNEPEPGASRSSKVSR